MATQRWDETWHRLIEWTQGQAPSERLASQILIREGFTDLDPSHPLGGKDGGKDAVCLKNGKRWIMAAYFPRGQQPFSAIQAKFAHDIQGVTANNASGIAFVTNQELRLSERESLKGMATPFEAEIYHLERVTNVIDTPEMGAVRKQFLQIDFETDRQIEEIELLKAEFHQGQKHIESLQTGGDTFCYVMLYHFDLERSLAQNFVVIRQGQYPLYDVRIRICDMDSGKDVFQSHWGEISAPAEYQFVKWLLPPSLYLRIFVHARNGQWHQDLILRRTDAANCWLAATIVRGKNGRDILFEHLDSEYQTYFENPVWRP